MAKTREVREANQPPVAATIPDLSKRVEKAVEAIKKQFLTFASDLAKINIRREELAPQFMKAFGLWQAETGGTFVAFIRYLDPSIGGTREEYRSHRSYQAADYLRRLVGNVARRDNNTVDAEQQARPVPPGEAFVRLLAAFMKLVPENQHGRLTEVMKEELKWTDNRIQQVTSQAEIVDPLVEIKGRTLENLKLTFPEHQEEAEEAA